MPPKKRPRLTSADLKLLETHLECPVCFEIPRDGVMLQCVNGHDVCATCKTKMDKDNKTTCPQGECDYDDPPRRNRTVAGLVNGLPFEFTCKYAKDDNNDTGCKFASTKELLGKHEEACQHRPVPCPRYGCKESVPVNKVVEHFATAHKVSAAGKSNENVIKKNFLWRPQYNTFGHDGGWLGRPQASSSGAVFPCAHLQNGHVYLWLVMLAPKSETDKFKCVMKLGADDDAMSFTAPVYPVDWSREKIMEDEDCVRLGIWSVRKMLTEDVTEDKKKEGYSSMFKATFKIVRKTG